MTEEILFETKTKYNTIRISREGTIVSLWSHDIRQSVVNLALPHLPQLEYVQNMLLSLDYCKRGESILVLGLGGGSIPTFLRHIFPNSQIDIVEIDAIILQTAEEFFLFKQDSLCKVFIEDASQYVTDCQKKYDIIFVDTYLGDNFPEHLMTPQFFYQLQRLSIQGVIAFNFFSGDLTPLYDVLRKQVNIFNHIWLIPGLSTYNVIVIAKTKLHWLRHLLFLKRQHRQHPSWGFIQAQRRSEIIKIRAWQRHFFPTLLNHHLDNLSLH